MKEDGLGNIFVRHLVMAIPWGIIFLVVFLIASIGVKQQIKEAIQFGAKTAISESRNAAFGYHMVVPVKQNVKEGMEFAAKTVKRELKNLLNDPQVKKNLKEILESGSRAQ
ncbi:MAG: hypothetical protein JRI72_16245 [Deltaproteobacteria bacterium]|nr:hypothetical protein [Deltaproteobacteria bacterium]